VTIGSGLGGFEAWLNLARDHEPGRIDAALKQEREISLERHFSLIVDLEALIEFVRNPDLDRLKKARRVYSQTEQAFLKKIAAIERVAGTTDKLLKRIALLESDGVMLTGGQKFIMSRPAPDSQGHGAVGRRHWSSTRCCAAELENREDCHRRDIGGPGRATLDSSVVHRHDRLSVLRPRAGCHPRPRCRLAASPA
jgi:hypothetical protein